MIDKQIQETFESYGQFVTGRDYALVNAVVMALKPQPQLKPLTDEELIIIKGKTCPEIDWESRRYVALNNGEHNAWLLTWFTAFARAIEAAHGIKENT